MARYFFHNAIDGSPIGDEDGEELPDIGAAQNAAVDVVSELLPLKRSDFVEQKRFSLNVKDDTGRLVISITATMTVDPTAVPEEPPLT